MPVQSVDILLVEDSAAEAELFKSALKDTGTAARVQVAHDGGEAWAYLFGEDHSPKAAPLVRPRLVVLDIKLPRINGMEVLQRLRANHHMRCVPIVILSGSGEARDLTVSYQLGINSYLVKPTNYDDLCGLVGVLANYWLRHNQLPKP